MTTYEKVMVTLAVVGVVYCLVSVVRDWSRRKTWEEDDG